MRPIAETLVTAPLHVLEAGSAAAIAEVVADSDYHKAATLAQCQGWLRSRAVSTLRHRRGRCRERRRFPNQCRFGGTGRWVGSRVHAALRVAQFALSGDPEV